MYRKLILAAAAALFFALPSFAQDVRTCWRYSDNPSGYFLYEPTRNRWVETTPSKSQLFFKETGRNGSSITLYDASRDVTVRLGTSRSSVKWASGPGNSFEKLYDGGWDDRVSFGYNKGRFVLDDNNVWHERNVSGSYTFKEVQRTDGYVILYDVSRSIWVRLGADHCDIHGRGEPWAFLYQGGWQSLD
jgi:hypothetical protein